ncbi:MAG: hypothetical protein IRZ15_01280 [Bryobacteraceae bacterium]|nr:hypothetical protein [Bryobacteraceae bacterium]
MMMRSFSLFIMLTAAALPVCADLSAVLGEPKLVDRSKKALEHGEQCLEAARSAWREGDIKRMEGLLEEVKQSVDLALQSLKETGKHPSKLLKHYKRAELKTRELEKRLQNFAQETSLDERALIESVSRHVGEVHEDFLLAVMSRKR